MTVSELITFLQNQEQDLVIAYCCYSEQFMFDETYIDVVELCLPRPDGWVQNKRPDKPTQKYLVFPGN